MKLKFNARINALNVIVENVSVYNDGDIRVEEEALEKALEGTRFVLDAQFDQIGAIDDDDFYMDVKWNSNRSYQFDADEITKYAVIDGVSHEFQMEGE